MDTGFQGSFRLCVGLGARGKQGAFVGGMSGFGSGKQIRFPPVTWITSLIHKQIGIETMDTQAACRTYNILASEGRSVALALLLELDLT